MEISNNYKKSKLKGLCENDLRKKVLIPLLTKMQYLDCIENHHSNEKGKDIVCKEYDERYNSFKYVAVIVKTTDITGSSSTTKSIFNLLVQVRQAINEPYKDIYNMSEVYIDKCIIVTTGRILPQAIESIYETLKREHLDKLISESIDIEKLISLIDKYFPEYWLEDKNEVKILREEKNILLNNLIKVTKVLTTDPVLLDKISHMILKQDFNININKFYRSDSFIADVNYDEILIDKIDPYYKSNIPIENIDSIPAETYKIKKIATDILIDMDEFIELLKKIISEGDPQRIIESCLRLKNYMSMKGGNYFIFESYGIPYVDDYYYFIKNYCERKQYLIQSNLERIHNMILEDAEAKVRLELESYYKNNSHNDKEYWLAYKFKIVNPLENNFKSETIGFRRKLQKVVKEPFNTEELEIEKIYENNNGFTVVEHAINCYYHDTKDKCMNEYVNNLVNAFRCNISVKISGYEDEY